MKTLVQMREGKTWTFGLQNNVVETVTSFTSDLMNEGLVQKILDILVNTGMYCVDRGGNIYGNTSEAHSGGLSLNKI